METFEQFLSRRFGQAGPGPVGQAPKPAALSPASPAPAPVPSPTPTVNPQQQMQQIAQVAAGMPPELIAMVAQAAQQSVQQPAPPLRQTPPLDMGPFIQATGGNPNRLASTAPVAAPTVAAPTTAAPRRQDEQPEGYIPVLVQNADGSWGNDAIFIPESRAKNLPTRARRADDQIVTDPVAIAAMREQGRLLEQQSADTQALFRTSEELFAGSQAKAQREGTQPLTDAGVIPAGSGRAMTNEQAAQTAKALGVLPPSPPPYETYTLDEIREMDPERGPQLAEMLQASGITYVQSNQEILQDPQTGQLSLRDIPAEGAEAPPAQDSSSVPGLTTTKLRQWHPELANELEATGFTGISDGQMVVRQQDGTLDVVPVAETAPEGGEILIYGGVRTASPSTDTSFLDSVTGALDVPREWAVGQLGDIAYDRVKNGTDRPIPFITMPGAQRLWEQLPTEHFNVWADANPELVAQVFETGYDSDKDGKADYTGGRAVWERYAADQNAARRITSDLALDPLNYLSGGGGVLIKGGRLVRGTDATTDLVRRGAGDVLDVTGRVLQAPDAAVDRVFEGLGTVGGGIIRNTPGLRRLLEPSAVAEVERGVNPLGEALGDVMARGRDQGQPQTYGPAGPMQGPTAPTAPPQGPTGPVRGALGPAPGPSGPVQGPGVPQTQGPPAPTQGPGVTSVTPASNSGIGRGPGPRTPLGGPDAEWNLPVDLNASVTREAGPLLTNLIDRARVAGQDASTIIRGGMRGVPTTRDARGVLADLTDEARSRLNPLQREVYDTVRGIQTRLTDATPPNLGSAVDNAVSAATARADEAVDVVEPVVDRVRANVPDVDVNDVRRQVNALRRGLATYGQDAAADQVLGDALDAFRNRYRVNLPEALSTIPSPRNVLDEITETLAARPGPLLAQAIESAADAGRNAADVVRETVSNLPTTRDARGLIQDLTGEAWQRLTPIQQEVYDAVRGVQSRMPDVDLPNVGAVVDDITDALTADRTPVPSSAPAPPPAAGISSPAGNTAAMPGSATSQAVTAPPTPTSAPVPFGIGRAPADALDETSLGRPAVADLSTLQQRWGRNAPTENGTRLIDQAWKRRETEPQKWDQFFTLVDTAITRHARYIDNLNRGSERARRRSGANDADYGTEFDKALATEEHLVTELGDAYTRVFGEPPPIQLGMQRRTGLTKSGKDARTDPNQYDAFWVEQAVRGDEAHSARAFTELRERAQLRDHITEQSLRRLEELRAQWLALQNGQRRSATPTPTPPASAFSDQDFDLRALPLSDVRTARALTPEQRADLGIPDFQMREQDFAEQSVRDIVENFDPNQYDPIKVMRANDGNFYVTSGHSRLEAFRRMGRETIPAQVQQGTGDRIARAAKLSNTLGTELTPIERGQAIRDLLADGDSYEQIADAMKQGDPSGRTLGTAEIKRYESTSHLPEGPARDAVLNRSVRLDMGAELGRAIQNEIMTPAELNSFFTRIVVPQRLTPARVRELITDHAQDKARGLVQQAGTALFGNDALGGSGFLDSMNRRVQLRRDRSPLVTERNSIQRTGKNTRLSREQENRLATLNEQIADLDRQIEGAREEVLVDVARPLESSLLRPMTEADAQARRAVDDVPGVPMIGTDQQMRGSGAQSLFFSRAAQSEATARRAYRTTLGRQVRNPSAQPKPVSRFVSSGNAPVTRLEGRVLGAHEQAVLGQRFSDGGDSIAERWQRYADEIGGQRDDAGQRYTVDQAERMAAERVMGEWAVETLRTVDPRKFAAYEHELRRLTTRPRDPVTDPVVAQARAFAAAMGKQGVRGLEGYDTVLAVLREMTLYNSLTGLRYVLTQGIGNTITALLTGNAAIIGQALDPGNVRGAYLEMGGGGNAADDVIARGLGRISGRPDAATPQQTIAEYLTAPGLKQAITDLGDMPASIIHDDTDQLLAELNLGGKRDDVHAVVRDEVTTVGRDLRTHEVANRLGLGRLSGVIANRHIRDFANALDLSYRKALYGHTMQANIADSRDAFRQLMLENLPRTADRAQFDELWDEVPLVFGSDRIRQLFGQIDQRYADQMARDWQNALGKMDSNARDEVRRVFFSGEEVKGDALLRRVVFFHYWMSRATPLYLSSLLKNPGVLNAYARMLGEMQEQAETGRYGKAVTGMLKLLGTPMGYNIFIRPDAFFQTFIAFGDQAEFAPDGENMMAKWMRESGLFFNPLIDAVVNLSGAEGDTFAPDPLMIGQWTRLIQNGRDLAKAQGWIQNTGPTGNFYNDLLARVRTQTSGVVWGTRRVPYRDSTQYAQRDINYLIQDVAEEQGLDPLGIEATAAMSDAQSPIYQEAFQRYAETGAMSQLARILPTSVLYPKVRIDRGDRIAYGIANTTQGSPEQQALYDQRTMAITTDPNARELRRQTDEYHSLGTPEQRDAYGTYNAIRYGGVEGHVRVNGVMLTERQLAGLGADERQLAADTWAAGSGKAGEVEAVRDARDAYRESNPEYSAYSDWASSVRDYEGGISGYWEDLIEGNPNAARWYETLDEPMTMDDLERKLTGLDAYMNAQGIQPTAYDPAPVSVNDPAKVPYNPAATTGGTGYPQWESDPAKGIAQDIADYRTKIVESDAQLQQLFGPGTTMEYIERQNPMLRDALMQHMRDAGLTVPSLSRRAQGYLDWAQAQPEGTENTIDAYLRWREAFMPATVEAPDNAGSLQLDELLSIIGQ